MQFLLCSDFLERSTEAAALTPRVRLELPRSGYFYYTLTFSGFIHFDN